MSEQEPKTISESERPKERALTSGEKDILKRLERIRAWGVMQRAIPEPTNYFKQRRFN